VQVRAGGDGDQTGPGVLITQLRVRHLWESLDPGRQGEVPRELHPQVHFGPRVVHLLKCSEKRWQVPVLVIADGQDRRLKGQRTVGEKLCVHAEFQKFHASVAAPQSVT